MSEHVLIVGPDRGDYDLARTLRDICPDVVTSSICGLAALPRTRNFHKYARLIGLKPDTSDQEWIAIAAAIHKEEPFTRIATFEDRDQRHAANIGRELGLVTNSPQTVAAANDKYEMRARLREATIDTTPAARIADAAALRRFVTGNGLPCIVKPITGEGSEGVSLLRDDISEEVLRGALEHAQAALSGGGRNEVLVERFHEGQQYSVEAFSEHGDHEVISIVRKFYDERSFVEIGHATPAVLAPPDQVAITEYVKAVLTALHVVVGPTHTEIVLADDGPQVIETHLRLAGDDIPELVRNTTGIDMAECQARQVLGFDVLPEIRAWRAKSPPHNGAAVWFAVSPTVGRLTGVDGLAEVRDTDGVLAAVRMMENDVDCRPPVSSDHRLAYARTVGDDEHHALVRARSAIARLRFQIVINGAAIP